MCLWILRYGIRVALAGFEKRLENVVEGVFSRVFKSALRPVELGRRIVREMEMKRSLGVNGKTLVPNIYVLRVAPGDFERFQGIGETLIRELAATVREHAREESYRFVGPVVIEFSVESTWPDGKFQVTSSMQEGSGGAGAGSLLFTSGARYVLGSQPVTIGRAPECEIALDDVNISRQHAQVRTAGDSFVVIDLGSTNGTYCNGQRISQQVLSDGDTISFGPLQVVFEAS